MRETKCPFCGREVAKGKYCIFCGNPLRGTAAAAAQKAAKNGGAAPSGKEDGAVWNPEEAYAVSRFRSILVWTLIGVIAAVIAAVWTGNLNADSRRTSSRPAETQNPFDPVPRISFSISCGIQPDMTLEEMSVCMENNGFERLGKPYRHADGSYQMFSGRKFLGANTEYSLAVAVEEGEDAPARGILHYFLETTGTNYRMMNRGPVFNTVLTNLMLRLGSPELRRDCFRWQAEDGTVTLRYIVDSEVEVQYVREGGEQV